MLIFAKIPASAMAIFPFILLKEVSYKTNKRLINHERIHLRQQLELLILPFYLLYLLHYLFNLIRYRNHHQAYLNIVFEKEAYACDDNLDYLKQRRFFSWLKFC